MCIEIGEKHLAQVPLAIKDKAQLGQALIKTFPLVRSCLLVHKEGMNETTAFCYNALIIHNMISLQNKQKQEVLQINFQNLQQIKINTNPSLFFFLIDKKENIQTFKSTKFRFLSLFSMKVLYTYLW